MANLIRAHQPCSDCGSHDALAVYDDGSTYCFSCSTYRKGNGEREVRYMDDKKLEPELLDAGVFPKDGIPDRYLTADTCKKFGVKVIVKSGGIAQHIYPYYDKDGNKIAIKVRTVEGKQFKVKGPIQNATLFGQNVFPAKGPYITITEGELDAMSVFQMQGSKYPVVSIKNGCRGLRDIKDNYEYLDSFDNIVLCWDGDEPGRKAVREIAALLPPKKVKIVKMPAELKDPNEFLKAGRVEEFKDLWWRAEDFKPQDIVCMGELWDRLQEFNKTRSYIPTPWEGVNDMMYGVRPSQVVVFAAGTGQGKSEFLKAFIQHLLKTTDIRVGAFFLEEVAEDTAISLMSLEAGKNLRKPDVWKAQTQEDLKRWFEESCADGRLDLFDGFDFDDIDLLMDKIRYLAKARDCKAIILDHITMIAEGSEENTTAKLNKLMSELKKIAVAEGIFILAACHLRKSANANKTHEEGGHVSLDDLKSSSSIKQLSDVVIGLERNSQDPDKIKANTTVLRILKNRDFGVKGPAAAVLYDVETTRLIEVALEDSFDE